MISTYFTQSAFIQIYQKLKRSPMDFDLQAEKAQPIDLAAFEQSQKKKQPRKNQLEQIQEFNSKTTKASDISQNGLESEFNISAWGQELQGKGKVDFFQEESKQLLGDERVVKFLSWKFICLDLGLHLITAYLSLSQGIYLAFLILDLPMLCEDAVQLADNFLNGKIIKTKRHIFHKVYKYTLIISILGSLILLLRGGIGLLDADKTIWEVYFATVFYMFTVVTEWQIWKMNRYLLFMTREMLKKESPEELELSDTL